jgi:diguanylate cyclase (GGDEF)-like protein
MAKTKQIKSRREYLRQGVIRGALIVIAATCVSIVLTAFTIGDLPFEVQQRAILTAVALPILIAPPAIAYTTYQDMINHDLMIKIHRMAHTDEMTGLANRRAFMGEAQEAIIQHDFAAQNMTVMIVDIDHFKRVNDQYGHAAGDEALNHIARIMLAVMPQDALIARLGGEEFAISATFDEMADLHELAETIRHSVAAQPLRYEDQTIAMTISIGITVAYESDTVSTLLSRADVALYDAKHTGRDQVAIAA